MPVILQQLVLFLGVLSITTSFIGDESLSHGVHVAFKTIATTGEGLAKSSFFCFAFFKNF